MEKIISLKNTSDINMYLKFDSFLVESKFSFASQFVLDVDKIIDLTNKLHSINKKIYLRADKILVEHELDELNYYINVFKIVDGVFFEDFCFVSFFIKNMILTKLIYFPFDSIGDKEDLDAILSTRIDKICVPSSKEYLLDKSDLSCLGYRILYREVLFNSRRKLLSLYNEVSDVIIDNVEFDIMEKTRSSVQKIVETKNGTIILNDIKYKKLLIKPSFILVDTLFIDDKVVNQYVDEILEY